MVRLLAHRYTSQQVSVLWNNIRSLPFTVNNGTKQGGVLSPCLFTRYLIELLVALSLSSCGCIIGNMSINVFAYADYLVILAPCWSAMQALLVICEGVSINTA